MLPTCNDKKQGTEKKMNLKLIFCLLLNYFFYTVAEAELI